MPYQTTLEISLANKISGDHFYFRRQSFFSRVLLSEPIITSEQKSLGEHIF